MIELHPGAGGSEAALFAAELLQMYRTLCANNGWRTELVEYEKELGPSGREALTKALVEVTAPGTYDKLRTEAGVHRVQRVPVTETRGRTHTSAVAVMVLPSFPESASEDSALNFEDPSSDYYIAAGDIKSELMRASGAGGQHVNKTESAIRLTHIPTGIVVASQEQRSQHANRDKAWQVMRAKVAQRRREEREQEIVDMRRKAMGGTNVRDRSDKVRTYNFSQNRVTDHRCSSNSSDLAGFMGGGEALEAMMNDVKSWMQEQEIEGMAAEEEVKAAKRRHGLDDDSPSAVYRV